MFMGIVSWEDASDATGKVKGWDEKSLEDSRLSFGIRQAFGAGSATVSKILQDDQTLVVYNGSYTLTRV